MIVKLHQKIITWYLVGTPQRKKKLEVYESKVDIVVYVIMIWILVLHHIQQLHVDHMTVHRQIIDH